jgi:predicted  nucleic acid-binding Zn-ribbon protein
VNGTLALLIPVLALAIPVAAIVLNGLQKLWQVRLEETRLRSGVLGTTAETAIEQLRSEVDQLRGELSEVHERLDFTERLLAQKTDRERLRDSSPPPPA